MINRVQWSRHCLIGLACWFLIQPILAAEYSGRWQIINYWSEWCAPCREEIPILNELFRSLTRQQIAVLGVNADGDPDDVSAVIADRLGIEFPLLRASERARLALPPPVVMPTTLIVDASGRVRETLVGVIEREQVLKVLATHGAINDVR